MANNSTVTVLKSVVIGLGCLMVATLIYTISIDGFPFRKDLLTPWMIATLVDFYINVIILAGHFLWLPGEGVVLSSGGSRAWVCYKESSWLAAVIWVILLACLGSAATCLYIAVKLYMLSAEESSHDPIYHLLLQPQEGNAMHEKSSFQLPAARVIFSLLGCLMLGVLVYTTLNYGSPFHKELLTPWMIATLIDFCINISALSAWIGYKESSWLTAFAWIVLLICCGREISFEVT
ncbi:hypothetical protein Cgig2_017583 [Carnegiea gigantea]|uniref:Uncharacterized protein n=1 Tax=Carnegiea gigantea TaxID=171969 RepID=A0A9Q1KKF6_9CARY|nr:hypothetical protein Cgig2_017583 [Carnegiea gigantea]